MNSHPHDWDAHHISAALLHLMPRFGRLMALFIQSQGESETTIQQVRYLFMLKENPITTSELARKHKVTLQAASAQVQGLVDKGWVQRIPDPNDRRQFRLEVTPDGMAHAHKARERLTAFLSTFIERLAPEEKHAAGIFLPALDRLLSEGPAPDEVDLPPPLP
ncbi:MAG: MarR family transcriptional regulator [Chloroflexi bacterium]|nr:MarR family transcriptional regulator [Chloroflexota bacterium]